MYEVNFDDTIADGIENNAKDGGLSTEDSLLNISSGCTLVALLRRACYDFFREATAYIRHPLSG